MTTHIEVVTNGKYVAEVKTDGTPSGSVGPGQNVRKSFYFQHGSVTLYEVSERAATEEEWAAYIATLPAPDAA